jgi:hypothetical protein
MKTFDDLSKDRVIISRLLKKESNGEINEFDFMVNFLSHPVEVTFMFGVRDKESFDIGDYKKFIEQLLSALGYSSRVFENVDYLIL